MASSTPAELKRLTAEVGPQPAVMSPVEVTTKISPLELAARSIGRSAAKLPAGVPSAS